MKDKTLYRVALQLYIESEENEQGEAPTIEEAKAAVEHRLALATAGEVAQGKIFEIFKDAAQTKKVVVNECGDQIELAYELEDTESDLLHSRSVIELHKDDFKRVAQHIVDTF